MANEVCNISLGRFVHYSTLPLTNDAIIVVPIETAGLEADGTLNNYDDLLTLLAASNNEQTTLGRKTVTSGVTVTIDDTNDWVDVDMPDQTYTAGTGNAISKLLLCYDNDTTGGTDSNIIPMTYHDFVITPDGSDIVAQIAAAGFARAAG